MHETMMNDSKMMTNRNINDMILLKLSLFSILILFLTINSCSTVSYEAVYPTLGDGKYDSEFPYKGSSDELERITQTVQRITSTGFYKTYFFELEDEVTIEQIRNNCCCPGSRLISESGMSG